MTGGCVKGYQTLYLDIFLNLYKINIKKLLKFVKTIPPFPEILYPSSQDCQSSVSKVAFEDELESKPRP